MSNEGTITEWMNLSDLCRRWQPGSKRDSELRDDWSWADEALEMIGGPHWLRTFELLLHIKENGIKEPIVLGHDGIVWDGHHRVIAARLLAIELVPVEVAERGQQQSGEMTKEQQEFLVRWTHTRGVARGIDGPIPLKTIYHEHHDPVSAYSVAEMWQEDEKGSWIKLDEASMRNVLVECR